MADNNDGFVEVGGGENGETWNREGSITGKYTNKQVGVGPNSSNLYTLETEDGPVGVWGSTVLDGKFDNIPVGATVRVTSLGKQKSARGNEYNDFKVEMKPVAEGTKAVTDVLGGEVI